MAKIEFEAFVEPWSKIQEQHPAWGVKTAETHRRKNDAGQYETAGRTFRTVKVSRSSGIDLTQFRKGDRVKVSGSEITETREHEGRKYYDLVVWADRIEQAEQNQRSQATSAPSAPANDSWAPSGGQGAFGDETPF